MCTCNGLFTLALEKAAEAAASFQQWNSSSQQQSCWWWRWMKTCSCRRRRGRCVCDNVYQCSCLSLHPFLDTLSFHSTTDSNWFLINFTGNKVIIETWRTTFKLVLHHAIWFLWNLTLLLAGSADSNSTIQMLAVTSVCICSFQVNDNWLFMLHSLEDSSFQIEICISDCSSTGLHLDIVLLSCPHNHKVTRIWFSEAAYKGFLPGDCAVARTLAGGKWPELHLRLHSEVFKVPV